MSTSQPNNEGETALMIASESGSEEYLNLLIQSGADVNRADKKGQTALIFAVKNGRLECIKSIIEAGADLSTRTNEHYTPISLWQF